MMVYRQRYKKNLNSEVLKKIIRRSSKEVYDEEKKKEQEEIIGNAKGKEGTI